MVRCFCKLGAITSITILKYLVQMLACLPDSPHLKASAYKHRTAGILHGSRQPVLSVFLVFQITLHAASDLILHLGVSLYILHIVVIQHSETSGT